LANYKLLVRSPTTAELKTIHTKEEDVYIRGAITFG